jgi:hypothetical protein
MNYNGTTIRENIIYGDLHIQNTNLTDLFGLSNIHKVMGTVYIENNKNLLNTNGLSNINYMKGLIIQNNEALSCIDFHNVIFIEGNVIVNNNYMLSSLNGLSGLTYIGGKYDDCSYHEAGYFNYGDLIIKDNAHLRDISGLSNIHTINGNLEINTNLDRVCVFENLNCVHYGISVKNNKQEFRNINSLVKCDNTPLFIYYFIIALTTGILFCIICAYVI